MNRKHRQLMQDLSAIRPIEDPTVEEWASSKRSQVVFRRIQTRLAMEQAQPTRTGQSRFPGVVWIAATSCLLGMAIAAALYLWLPVTGGELAGGITPRVSANAGSAPTPVSGLTDATHVSDGQAMTDIIALADTVYGSPAEQPGRLANGQRAGLQRAVDVGLIGRGGMTANRVSTSVTRAEFALWLWKMFNPVLRQDAPVIFSDLDSLSLEERVAVERLAGSGIIPAFSDGTFRGHQPLSATDEEAFLARVKDAATSTELSIDKASQYGSP